MRLPCRRSGLAGLLSLLTLCCAPAAFAQAAAEGEAQRFNGTWVARSGSYEAGGRERFGEFRIWALDERRLRVEFQGHYAYKTADGINANVGEASEVAVLEDGTARFETEGGGCAFALRLRGGVLWVVQTGDACFGMHVDARGKYRRTDASRPTFPLSEPR